MNDLGRYSRTYRFGDISYQSASDEAQAAVCKRMRMLYNGLTPEVSMQTTLVTRPIHESEIGNRTFFEVRDDPTGPLAEEYNDVLNGEDARGRLQPRARALHNLRRGRPPDAGHAVPRARPDALDGLRRAHGDQERPLPARRRRARGAPALDAQARRAPRSPVDWSEVAAHRGTTTKDLVAPNLIDFKPQGSASAFTMDGTWFQVLAFRRFESNLSDRCPRRHGRPSDPPRHLDPRARARAEQGHRLRQAAPQLDRQGGRGGPDERRQEGLRLHPAPRRAALHARRGAGHVRAPQRGRQPAPVSATAAWR